MAVKVSQIEETFGGAKNGRRKGVGSAIRRRRANRVNVAIKEKGRGRVVQ